MKKNPTTLNGQEELASTPESQNTTQASPARRARLLEKSRNAWKFKTKEKQNEIKAQKVKARDLEISRQAWKERAKQAEQKLKEAMDKLRDSGIEEAHQKKSE